MEWYHYLIIVGWLLLFYFIFHIIDFIGGTNYLGKCKHHYGKKFIGDVEMVREIHIDECIHCGKTRGKPYIVPPINPFKK